jgi:hypothetical protein
MRFWILVCNTDDRNLDLRDSAAAAFIFFIILYLF